MPKLPTIDDCTACGVCVDTCAHGAISMREDKNGYYNIVINDEKCIDCKLCEKKCHVLNQDKLHRHEMNEVSPLAGWSTDEELIKRSATGAIFAQIACDMLTDGNTYVYGASLQKDSMVKHIEISDVSDIYKLQNSKYQQSVTVGIFKQVKRRLKEGYRVLFSGVPCQIGALYTYLGNQTTLLENLYTIEVICHGVPTNMLHRLGIKYNKAERVVAYRTKEHSGWIYGSNNRVVYETENGKRKYMDNHTKDFLFRAYLSLSFSFSRKNCYSCKYSMLKRVSDLTIGDFWGFEKSEDFYKLGNYMGTSVIMPNSNKGRWMISQSDKLHLVPAKWEDILPLNQNLYMPSNRYAYTGYDKVATIMRLPEPFRKFIFMNGFTNKYINRMYNLIANIFFARKRKNAYAEIDEEIKKALIYLNKNEQ